jgi:uncharacterized protein RhaS with RHS repeats
VKKTLGAVVTVFVYDALGKLVAEYTNTAPSQNGTQYLTTDHLGTPRVVTGGDGSVKARHDYLPFGEKVSAGTGGAGSSRAFRPTPSSSITRARRSTS